MKILDNYVEVESDYFKNGVDVLSHFATNQTFYENENVYSKLNSLISRRTFNPVSTTFQELISTGSIGILEDKPTKRKIIQYYHELERISLVIGNNNIHIVDAIYQPEILKHTLFTVDEGDPELEKMNDGIFDRESLSNIRKLSKSMLSDPNKTLHLFNLVEQRTFIAQYHMGLYKNLHLQTKELLVDIKDCIRAH